MTTLTWAVKESLISYILTAAEGSVDLAEPATRIESGAFVYQGEGPGGALPDEAGANPLRFRGGVELRGHGGMLNLPLADPWIERTASGYALSIADPDDAEARVTFATIKEFVEVDGGLRASGTALTLDGSDLFFGPYSEGTAFDDPIVTFS